MYLILKGRGCSGATAGSQGGLREAARPATEAAEHPDREVAPVQAALTSRDLRALVRATAAQPAQPGHRVGAARRRGRAAMRQLGRRQRRPRRVHQTVRLRAEATVRDARLVSHSSTTGSSLPTARASLCGQRLL